MANSTAGLCELTVPNKTVFIKINMKIEKRTWLDFIEYCNVHSDTTKSGWMDFVVSDCTLQGPYTYPCPMSVESSRDVVRCPTGIGSGITYVGHWVRLDDARRPLYWR